MTLNVGREGTHGDKVSDKGQEWKVNKKNSATWMRNKSRSALLCFKMAQQGHCFFVFSSSRSKNCSLIGKVQPGWKIEVVLCLPSNRGNTNSCTTVSQCSLLKNLLEGMLLFWDSFFFLQGSTRIQWNQYKEESIYFRTGINGKLFFMTVVREFHWNLYTYCFFSVRLRIET